VGAVTDSVGLNIDKVILLQKISEFCYLSDLLSVD